MLAKDERTTGIGTNATPFVEAMSVYIKSADGAHAMQSATDIREGIQAQIYPGRTLTVVA
jgi:hypothetical protein